MNSIGSKIQAALIGSVILLAVCALIVLTINQLGTWKNQKIIDTMTTEYSISTLSDALILSYNDVVKNPDNIKTAQEYQSIHSNILHTLEILRNTVTSPNSKAVLIGVEHTVNQVIGECDTGIKEVKDNNFQFISDHYAQAHKNNEFVHENVTTLLQRELEYLYQTQKNTQRIYQLSMSVSVILFIAIALVIVLFARIFSRQLIMPLTKLSVTAKGIAAGNLQAMSQQSFTPSNDEVGSLTESIRAMVDKLTGMLTQQQSANTEIRKATETLKEKNDELMRMNALMVDRELKMVELKKEIETLKSKLPTA
jgi:methyl-accepting chemotaxis protein